MFLTYLPWNLALAIVHYAVTLYSIGLILLWVVVFVFLPISQPLTDLVILFIFDSVYFIGPDYLGCELSDLGFSSHCYRFQLKAKLQSVQKRNTDLTLPHPQCVGKAQFRTV